MGEVMRRKMVYSAGEDGFWQYFGRDDHGQAHRDSFSWGRNCCPSGTKMSTLVARREEGQI